MAATNRRTSHLLRHSKLSLLTLAALALPLTTAESIHAQQSSEILTNSTLAQLRAGFASPPPSARMRCYWWWLNGNTDKATITHDLEEMKAKGFGGALLVDGRRVAHKRAWGGSGSHRWIDDLGRAWDTIEFLPVETAEEAAAAG